MVKKEKKDRTLESIDKDVNKVNAWVKFNQQGNQKNIIKKTSEQPKVKKQPTQVRIKKDKVTKKVSVIEESTENKKIKKTEKSGLNAKQLKALREVMEKRQKVQPQLKRGRPRTVSLAETVVPKQKYKTVTLEEQEKRAKQFKQFQEAKELRKVAKSKLVEQRQQVKLAEKKVNKVQKERQSLEIKAKKLEDKLKTKQNVTLADVRKLENYQNQIRDKIRDELVAKNPKLKSQLEDREITRQIVTKDLIEKAQIEKERTEREKRLEKIRGKTVKDIQKEMKKLEKERLKEGKIISKKIERDKDLTVKQQKKIERVQKTFDKGGNIQDGYIGATIEFEEYVNGKSTRNTFSRYSATALNEAQLRKNILDRILQVNSPEYQQSRGNLSDSGSIGVWLVKSVTTHAIAEDKNSPYGRTRKKTTGFYPSGSIKQLNDESGISYTPVSESEVTPVEEEESKKEGYNVNDEQTKKEFKNQDLFNN